MYRPASPDIGITNMIDAHADAFLQRINSPNQYSQHTRQAYASDVRSFVSFLRNSLEHKPTVDDFTSTQVRAYLGQQRGQGLQASTLQRRRASLRRFADYLLAEGLLDADPTEAVDPPVSLKRKPSIPRLLTERELQKLDNAIRASQHARSWRDCAIVAVFLETGLGTSSLVQLDQAGFDASTDYLRISGENGDSLRVQVPQSSQALRAYLQKGRPEMASVKEDALFVSQMGGRMSRQSVWHMLRRWGEVADIHSEVTPRVLRHTAVRRMLLSGRSTKEIKSLLGHRNTQSTEALIRRLKAAQA